MIQVSYAIGNLNIKTIKQLKGVAEPTSIFVDTYGTGTKPNAELLDIINKNFNLRPGVIVQELDLARPIYQETAAYGHFGRMQFTWEQPKKLVY